MTLNEWCEAAYFNAVAHGFNGDDTTPERLAVMLALIHSEVSEALEALRVNPDPQAATGGAGHKPEGFCYELADIFLRLAHLARLTGVDLEAAVDTKHCWNITRAVLHGKGF